MLDLIAGAWVMDPPLRALVVGILGMVLLAVIDIWRCEVEDYATGLLLLLTVGALALDGIGTAQWIAGAISALVAFAVYMALGMRGVMGGGDVKLSVVPGLVLGACNPFLGVWWIAGALLIHQALIAASTAGMKLASTGQKGSVALPHVPAMTVAMVVGTLVFL